MWWFPFSLNAMMTSGLRLVLDIYLYVNYCFLFVRLSNTENRENNRKEEIEKDVEKVV